MRKSELKAVIGSREVSDLLDESEADKLARINGHSDTRGRAETFFGSKLPPVEETTQPIESAHF